MGERSGLLHVLTGLAVSAGFLLSSCATKEIVSTPDSTSTASAADTTAASNQPPGSNTPSAPAEPETTSDTVPQRAGIGSTITLEGFDSELAVTVTDVVDPLPAGAFFTPDPGTRFVGVQLRLVNTGSQTYSDSPSNGAKLVDVDRQEYLPDLFVDSVATFASVTIGPEDTRLGWIAFTVPDSVEIERFTLALDSGFATEVGQWDLTSGVPNDPAPKVTVPAATLGDSLTLTGFNDVVITVTLLDAVDGAPPGDQFSTPAPNSRLFAVRLELANTGTVVYSDSPTNGITLVDAAGQMYSPSLTASTAEGPALGVSLAIGPGDSRVGWVVFELPTDQTAVKILLALDSGFATMVGEWGVRK